jgi:hypothetical protein
MKTLAVLIVCLASVALAEDFKTINGKEYKNVTVKRVEPDGFVVSSKSGILSSCLTRIEAVGVTLDRGTHQSRLVGNSLQRHATVPVL